MSVDLDLNKVVSGIKAKYKKDGRFNSVDVADNELEIKGMVSTGNLAFDLCTNGGIPWGHVTEFAGFSSSGKSLMIQQIIANAMREYNAIGILADREGAYTKLRGQQLGIDNNELVIAKPIGIPKVKDCFEFLITTILEIREQEVKQNKKLIDSGKEPVEPRYIVVGIDSVSAFDKDTSLEKSDSGRKALHSHEGLRALLPLVDERIMVLTANQKTYKIGVMYGDNTTTTLGESWKYYSTVRLSLEDRKLIRDPKQNNEAIGNWIKAEVVKTRLGPCYRSCYIKHLYETGIDYYSGYGRLLSHRGYLKPGNKTEFDAFRQSTLKYEKDNDKHGINEHEMERALEKFPELLFDRYPPFKKEDEKASSEESDS